jgi:hypothetical protein
MYSYLRFDVQGLNGTITRATLRISANSSSTAGYDVSGVADNSWGETTITFNNRPVYSGVAGSSGAIEIGWTSVDVTSLIGGQGTFSLALTSTDTNQLTYASRESGANAPQLVIETAP